VPTHGGRTWEGLYSLPGGADGILGRWGHHRATTFPGGLKDGGGQTARDGRADDGTMKKRFYHGQFSMTCHTHARTRRDASRFMEQTWIWNVSRFSPPARWRRTAAAAAPSVHAGVILVVLTLSGGAWADRRYDAPAFSLSFWLDGTQTATLHSAPRRAAPHTARLHALPAHRAATHRWHAHCHTHAHAHYRRCRCPPYQSSTCACGSGRLKPVCISTRRSS